MDIREALNDTDLIHSILSKDIEITCWIKGTPITEGDYICYRETGDFALSKGMIVILRWDGKKWSNKHTHIQVTGVTHWMDLPSPPTETLQATSQER